jgi:energy coupling factor transporter S component ThiW
LKTRKEPVLKAKDVALAAVLTALAVVLATFLWFPAGPTKCFPGQHIVNAVAGILLGPWYAVAIATATGAIRNFLGLGTVFAFPGGIPGGLVVGLIYRYLWKKDYAALTEPLGTVAIGATISSLIVAPMIGREMTLTFVWTAFAISSIPGCIIGFITIKALRKSGIIS